MTIFFGLNGHYVVVIIDYKSKSIKIINDRWICKEDQFIRHVLKFEKIHRESFTMWILLSRYLTNTGKGIRSMPGCFIVW